MDNETPTGPDLARHATEKTISHELYWGLLFAEQDAGGCLIPGRFSRNPDHIPSAHYPLMNGQDTCGCIHGAAILAGGREEGWKLSGQLDDVGITAGNFDLFAREEIAQDFCVTVESTLSHFGVSVREDPSDG